MIGEAILEGADVERPDGLATAQELAYWEAELNAAKKRTEEWHKKAAQLSAIYAAEKKQENSFNILYSNTETLLPALYSQPPRPQVRRRFLDADPVGKAAADVANRALTYLIDSPDTQYLSLDSALEYAVLGALVPGQGVTRFRYDPEFEELPEMEAMEGEDPAEEAAEDPSVEGVENPDNASPLEEPTGPLVYEAICAEDVTFDRILFGFAKKWKNVPWVAFYHPMSKADLEKNFGEVLANKIPLTVSEAQLPGADADGEKVPVGNPKYAVVWEIWAKEGKEVLFYAEGLPERVVQRLPDPLGLSGFFPCVEPLRFLLKANSLVPTPLYELYENQAKELNRVTQRIAKITEALKVRGFYDARIKDISELMGQQDNTLLPAQNLAALLDSGTLEKHIWMMPLDKLIQVLDRLYIQRNQIKEVIYEVTGISDILRGSSVASETATAQNIKNQWGTLRLKRMQRAVQKYVRDCLRLMTELLGEKFSPETFAAMTQLTFVRAKEKQQAQMLLQQMEQMQAQQAAAQPPGQPTPPGQPGQPPASPPPNPQMEQLKKTASSISWEEIIDVLRNDMQRSYRIDVETNSTIDADATEDKKNFTELLGGISQLFQSLGPAVGQGQLPVGALKAMLLTFTRKFQAGPEIEDQLMQMAEQMPQKPDPQADKAKLEMQMLTQEGEQKAKEGQMRMAELQQKHAVDMDKLAKQQELQNQNHAFKMKEMEFKLAELQMKMNTIALTPTPPAKAVQ